MGRRLLTVFHFDQEGFTRQADDEIRTSGPDRRERLHGRPSGSQRVDDGCLIPIRPTLVPSSHFFSPGAVMGCILAQHHITYLNMTQRKRSKMTRFDPKMMQKLRDEIAKHPNPMFGAFIKENRASDGDILDLAMGTASAYFSGALLEPVVAAAGRELQKATRRAVLVTAAKFGATAIFDEEGTGATLKSAWSDDPITHIDAIQRLVDTGLTVAVAMEQFPSGPPEKGHTDPAETRHLQLPALEKLSTSILH